MSIPSPCSLPFSESLSKCAQGGKLDLASQGLRFYPDELTTEWGLTYVRLDDNAIRHIPRKFGLLTTLTELSLKNNQLQDLPETFTGLQRVRLLQLDGNAFTEVCIHTCT